MAQLALSATADSYGIADAHGIADSREIKDEQHLLRAFRTFAETAGSLEHFYSLLRSEVTRLRQELEQSHAGLARSLDENRSMRKHLDRILESLPCGVVVVSSVGEITHVNPEGKRLLDLEEYSGDPAGHIKVSDLRGDRNGNWTGWAPRAPYRSICASSQPPIVG